MASVLPALNSDCAASILSHLDKSSLISIASTSKAGKAATLPLLVHTVELYTGSGGYARIISLSRYVLSNQLGHYMRHLKIQHECVRESEANPDFLSAMQPLVDLVAASDNLASLTIPDNPNNLFNWAPGLTDAICAHAPSHTLEIGCMDEWDWLFARPFSGLRDLRLRFDTTEKELTEKELNIFTITAPSAKTLNTIHLGGLRIRFKEGDMPCEAVHMVSFYNVVTTPMDIHRAFPNVRLISTDWSEVSAGPSSQLASASRYGPEILPNLIALNGEMDALKLAPHHNIRVLRLTDVVFRKSELERVASTLCANTLSSLSFNFTFMSYFADEDAQLSDNFVFSWLLQNFSQIKFLDLCMNWRNDIFGFNPIRGPGMWNNVVAVCSSACEHLASLQHLKFVVLGFDLDEDDDLPLFNVLRSTAKECLRSLPQIDYFVLNLSGEMICVTRRRDLYPGPGRTDSSVALEESGGCGQIWTSVCKPNGSSDDDDIFSIGADEGRRIMDWYRWEGSDARLAGVQEWLESVKNS